MRVGVYINPGGCSSAGGVEVSRQVVVVLGIGPISGVGRCLLCDWLGSGRSKIQ